MNTTYYQQKLLDKIKEIYPSLSKNVINAYLETPRHLYVPTFLKTRTSSWINVNESNLQEYLDVIYSDNPLVIYLNSSNQHSTISQPSFVLKMIDMLDLHPGDKVFELGAGSGWNAALMGKMVGPHGSVTSLEIIPELAKRAKTSLLSNHVENVSVINADAGNGWQFMAPYDRAIFTAGASDFPKSFFSQIKSHGTMIYVFKNKSGNDQLFLLKNKDHYFESEETLLCSFVPMTGKYSVDSTEVEKLEHIMQKHHIANTIVNDKSFSWIPIEKMDSYTKMDFLKFMFNISAENIYLAEHDEGDISCAYIDEASHSMALIKNSSIVSYGNLEAIKKFINELQKWMRAGRPSSLQLKLRIYPQGSLVETSEAEWMIPHQDSIFVWSAKERILTSLWPDSVSISP